MAGCESRTSFRSFATTDTAIRNGGRCRLRLLNEPAATLTNALHSQHRNRASAGLGTLKVDQIKSAPATITVLLQPLVFFGTAHYQINHRLACELA